MRDRKVLSFRDAPSYKELESFLSSWLRLELSVGFGDMSSSTGLLEQFQMIREKLSVTESEHIRGILELAGVKWLYALVRLNIKRGRQFELSHVLDTYSADCLGYSKLFTILGRFYGLDAGVVEVVADNAGRLVPHTAIMVKLSGGKLRFIDFWYGSQDIKHRVIGLHVRRGKGWEVEDVDYMELKKLEVDFLSDTCVDGITGYINANRHLNRQKYDEAIDWYTKALALYFGNPRFHYNRAIAYEKLGLYEEAESDYSQALRDDNAIRRILAREYAEETSLIKLDGLQVDERTQQMYLLRNGIITGRKVPLRIIAKKFGLTEGQISATLNDIDKKMD